MNLDAVHAAARDLDDIEQAIAHVDPDRDEDLLRQARDARRDDAIHVLGRAEQSRGVLTVATARRPSSNAAAMRAARAAPMPVSCASSCGDARDSAATPPAVAIRSDATDERRTIAHAGTER